MRDAEATVTVEMSGGPTLQSHTLRVEIIRGPLAGKVFEHVGPEAAFGSGADCDIVLADKTVSHRHATMYIEGDSIRVLDADSRNGTLVDNVRVKDAFAKPDSTIAMGATAMRLKMIRELIELPLSSRESFGGLLGTSAAIRRVYSLLERVADSNVTVLVLGETGTGKEVTAAAIHSESRRASGPFVVVDCSAMSPLLLESELFGHVRGAFTGAVSDRKGRFREADGGTLFLDEIGEMPLDLQPKLLRALESRRVTPIGSDAEIHVDVRIIAATNRDLASEVDRGRFRSDLYYRLAVVPVRLPALRERADDIPLLVRHFEKDWLPRAARPARIHESIVERMKGLAWAGNVRELRNKVELMAQLGLGELPMSDADASDDAAPPGAITADIGVPYAAGRETVNDAYTRDYFERMLGETGWNVSKAAERAGVGRAFVQRVMRKHALRRGEDD